ncbi:MAG TPA: phosphoribosyltransferase family protein [Acidobacteriota bacterium]|jgi:putative phosphoribosyl transferase
MSEKFRNRREAGTKLARKLKQEINYTDAVAITLTPESVPVGYEVARKLELPLDFFLVRKLGLPGCQEIVFGAVATGGARILNNTVYMFRLSEGLIDLVANHELKEIERCEKLYRGDRKPLNLADRTVIMVDDGLTDGSSIAAAIAALRQRAPARMIVAAPVISQDALDEFRSDVDGVVTVIPPVSFGAERWYEHLPVVTDEEARHLLEQACEESAACHA